MIWIFALGIIGFCIVSTGFRKFTFVVLGVGAVIVLGIAGNLAYQDHIQKQHVAALEAQARIESAKYPRCVGADQTQAWLDAGGKCRPETGDADMDAVMSISVAEKELAKSKPQQN